MDFEIVCIDDDTSFLSTYPHALSTLGYSTKLISDPREALNYISQNSEKILAVLSDLKMPEFNGIELRQTLMPQHSEIPFLLVSGFLSDEIIQGHNNLTITDFVNKPFESKDLKAALQSPIKKRLDSLNEQKELLASFLEESIPFLEKIEAINLTLSAESANPETFKPYLRMLHTLKGTAASLGLANLASYLHKFEDYALAISHGGILATDESIGVLCKATDTVKALMLGEIKPQGADGVATLAAIFEVRASAPVRHNTETTRAIVSAPKVDAHSTQQTQINELPKSAPAAESEKVSVALDTVEEFIEIAGSLTTIRSMMAATIDGLKSTNAGGSSHLASLSESLRHLEKQSAKLQGNAEALKKIPLTNVFRPLKRAVRDLALALGKKIELKLEGEAIRVDRSIANTLSNSMIHLLRNGVDHGIESPADRIKTGKPPEGTITCFTQQTEGFVTIKIRDDGRGIDPNKIRAKALEKKLRTPSELEALSDKEVLLLIFESGFSTAAQVSDVSGRGVGMDMVRHSVREAKGTIVIDSVVGQGSEFTITIPIPKACIISKMFIARIGTEIFAIPRDEVSKILEIRPALRSGQISPLHGEPCLRHDNLIIPILNLTQLDRTSMSSMDFETEMSGFSNIIVLRKDNVNHALLIHEIQKMEELVLRPLDSVAKMETSDFINVALNGREGVALVLDTMVANRLVEGIKSRRTQSEVTEEIFQNGEVA